MTDRFSQIGFSRHICLEWLEHTANLVLAGNDETAISGILDESLRDQVAVGSSAKRNARDKTVTILMKTWANVQPELGSFRDRGLRMIKETPMEQHVAIHYGMAMAAYPFLKTVAENTGRLLRLQDTVKLSQIQRRLRDVYGDRETVSRSTRYAISSLVDWGILSKGASPGFYESGQVCRVDNEEMAIWLMEALLHATENGRAPMSTTLNSPALFPFSLTYVPSDLVPKYSQVDVVRHGLDQKLLVLRTDLDSLAARNRKN
ncbi:MAG: hypothetical protein ACOX38_09730 [Bacillota bacterium]|jgi:hypothetical protein